MTQALVVAGWILVGFFFALWFGERARRIDAQRREARVPVLDVPKATVVPPGGAMPETADGDDIAEAKERYVEECAAEGYSPEAAARDFEEMMNKVGTDQGSEGWGGSL